VRGADALVVLIGPLAGVTPAQISAEFWDSQHQLMKGAILEKIEMIFDY